MAGIGKSFLAQMLRERAASQGWRVGVGTASKVEGEWPYAPVLDALADLCRRHPNLLDGLDDRCRADIERALAGRDLDWSGDAAHPRLYVAVAELIRLASAGRGALLTIDNLHEADEASLRLLHYLARTGMNDRFVLLLSHRRQPITDTFEQMRSSLLARDAATDVPLMPGLLTVSVMLAGSENLMDPELLARIEQGDTQALAAIDPQLIFRLAMAVALGVGVSGTVSFLAIPLLWFRDQKLGVAVLSGLKALFVNWRPYTVLALGLAGLLVPVVLAVAILFQVASSAGLISVVLLGLVMVIALGFQLVIFGTQYASFREIYGLNPGSGGAGSEAADDTQLVA
jgi:hypothetical protein